MTDYNKYNVLELKEEAKKRGLKGYSKLRKADLINLIQAKPKIQTKEIPLQALALIPSSKVEKIAPDILRKMLFEMESKDIVNFCNTSKYLKNVVCNDLFWTNVSIHKHGNILLFGKDFKKQFFYFLEHPIKARLLQFLFGKIFYEDRPESYPESYLFAQVVGWTPSSEKDIKRIYSTPIHVYVKLLEVPAEDRIKIIENPNIIKEMFLLPTKPIKTKKTGTDRYVVTPNETQYKSNKYDIYMNGRLGDRYFLPLEEKIYDPNKT